MSRIQRLRDVAVPVALLVIGLVTLPLLHGFSGSFTPIGPLAAALVVIAATVTALRRRWPGPALIAAAAATSAYLISGYPYGPILISFGVGVYSVARLLPLRPAVLWSSAALAIMLVHTVTGPLGLAGLAPGAAWVIVPFTVGAARRLVVEAQVRERAATERRIADAERLRLSQEVHDVVGHGLAAIQMQADIALHLRDTRPEMAHEALTAISAASYEALEELRATLAGVPPSPGLSGVEELCARIRTAGVSVTLTVSGAPAPLSPAADVAAYRVLQESLTNVVKHASERRATVTIHHTPEAVDLHVTNPALPVPHHDGFGLTGMRRRVAQLGGHLTAAPSPPGTFTVHATLPSGADPTPPPPVLSPTVRQSSPTPPPPPLSPATRPPTPGDAPPASPRPPASPAPPQPLASPAAHEPLPCDTPFAPPQPLASPAVGEAPACDASPASSPPLVSPAVREAS
ncbi:sensor histidine kinase [Actinoplanes sp. NPDC049596]|uniref:sensor histidine kinase n=1 Tax=unclassified Actinoplanes TaxID=2626549 RepID=UPI00341263B6